MREINEKFQDYKDTTTLVTQMLETIAAERETGSKQVDKQDAQSFKTATKIINELSIEISKIESTEDIQKEKFKKELDKLIPVLL